MQLIKDIFLSSDKTLYKIGFFVKKDKKSNQVNSYESYVYDDSFSPAKDDLAYYFYNSFLGLSTEKNSKLQTNNFYNYTKKFVEEFISGFESKNHIMSAIDRDMVSKSKQIIHPEDYQELFPEEIQDFFIERVLNKLPAAILKDVTVLSDVQTKRIRINDSVLLIAKNGVSGEILIGNPVDPKFAEKVKANIDSGKRYVEVMIPEVKFNDINTQ